MDVAVLGAEKEKSHLSSTAESEQEKMVDRVVGNDLVIHHQIKEAARGGGIDNKIRF